jgi:hypothetical protein
MKPREKSFESDDTLVYLEGSEIEKEVKISKEQLKAGISRGFKYWISNIEYYVVDS